MLSSLNGASPVCQNRYGGDQKDRAFLLEEREKKKKKLNPKHDISVSTKSCVFTPMLIPPTNQIPWIGKLFCSTACFT